MISSRRLSSSREHAETETGAPDRVPACVVCEYPKPDDGEEGDVDQPPLNQWKVTYRGSNGQQLSNFPCALSTFAILEALLGIKWESIGDTFGSCTRGSFKQPGCDSSKVTR